MSFLFFTYIAISVGAFRVVPFVVRFLEQNDTVLVPATIIRVTWSPVDVRESLTTSGPYKRIFYIYIRSSNPAIASFICWKNKQGNGEKNILSWYLGAWINVFTPWDCVSNTCRSFSRNIHVWTDCRFICNMTQIRSLQFDPLTQIATIFWQSTKRFELMKWFFLIRLLFQKIKLQLTLRNSFCWYTHRYADPWQFVKFRNRHIY